MRPRRFQPWAEQIIRQSPAIASVEPIEGDPPFVSRVQLATGAQIIIQWVGAAPPGGDHPDQEERIVTGPPPEPVKVPELATSGRVPVRDVEQHLAALITNGGNEEISAVAGYSQIPGRGESGQRHGLRIDCHSGGAVFGLFRRTLPAGVPSGADWDQREEV